MFLLEHEKTIMKYKKIDNMLFAMFYILSAKLDGLMNSLKLSTT